MPAFDSSNRLQAQRVRESFVGQGIMVLAPTRGARFRMEGRVLKSGRTISVCEGGAYAISDGKEKLVASMACTLMAVTGRADIGG